MELTKIHKTIGAAIGLIAMGSTGVTILATKTEVHAVERKIDRHDLEHQREDIQRQVWNCRDKYGDDFNKASPKSRDECRDLEVKLDDIKDKLRGGK